MDGTKTEMHNRRTKGEGIPRQTNDALCDSDRSDGAATRKLKHKQTNCGCVSHHQSQQKYIKRPRINRNEPSEPTDHGLCFLLTVLGFLHRYSCLQIRSRRRQRRLSSRFLVDTLLYLSGLKKRKRLSTKVELCVLVIFDICDPFTYSELWPR